MLTRIAFARLLVDRSRPARSFALGASLIVGGSFLISCSRSQEEVASASAPIDACALITAEEVAAILGNPVAAPTNSVIGAGGEAKAAASICSFTPASGTGPGLTVMVRRSPRGDNSPESVRSALSEAGSSPQNIAGLGDAAFWAVGQLHVFRGRNDSLIVSVTGGRDDADAMTKARSVAEKVLARW